MSLNIRSLLSVTLLGLLVTGCSPSSSSSGSSTVVESKVNGYVGASNIFKSTIFAVPIDVQGQPKLDTEDQNKYAGNRTISDSKAYYVVGVAEEDSPKPILFIANALAEDKTTKRCELDNGCAKAKANYGDTYTLNTEFKLRAAVSSVGDGSRVNINWITHLAADIAYTTYIDETGDKRESPNTAAPGMYTPFTIERGNLWLSKQFKISDVISYRPISPSQLNQADGLVEGLREEGIRYGALLAGGQKLASDKNLSDTDWVTSIVEQQRELQGQLYINHQDKFSMCKLYEAAETVLNDNLKRQTGLSADVSASATNALAELKDERDDACSANNLGDKTKIKVEADEIKGWADSFKQAKEFVEDLNSRFLNMRCDNPDTTKEGFFDCDYVNVTQDYYNNLESFYKNNKADLTIALHAMRADIEDFIRCLNDLSPCGTEYENAGLTYTLVPVESTKVTENGVNKYYGFDFRITGKRSISSKLSLTFNEIPEGKKTDEITESDYNYIRVVYQGDNPPLKTPAKLAFGDENNNAPSPEEGVEQGVEPLGFDINIPSVTIKNTDESFEFKDFNLYFFSAKLLGVKPIFDEHKAMHYNLTEVSAGLNVQGDILGNIMEEGEKVELANTAELTFKAKFSDAANYYAPSIWPDANDYFVTDSGVVAPKVKPGLFEYNLVRNKNILISSTQAKDGKVTETWGNADYLELTVAGTTNRYEKYKQDERYALRNCLVNKTLSSEAEQEKQKICRASETVLEDFSVIDDLIYSEEKYFSNFAIPAYGSYKPDIPEGVTWGEGTWNGILVAEFAQGVDNFELRIGQEFVDDSGGNIKRRPSAILKVKANKKTDTNWELAASMGYKYKYLVDVLPMGEKDTQSFYFAYSVKEFTDADGSKTFVEELGSLSIIRAGTKLFQLEEGKTVNGTLASRVDYEIDKDVVNNCGYSGHQVKTKSCNAIAYLTVRGKLLGVLREENGAYVMRYSDGTWSLIGGN